MRRLGGCEWGALWAEANPSLPQAPGPPRPGLVPVSIIGAEDEDFENELEAVRSWSGKASVPGAPAPQVPSSVSPPTSGPVLCPQMLSRCSLSKPFSLVFVVPPSSSPHPILDPTLFYSNLDFYRCSPITTEIPFPSLVIYVFISHLPCCLLYSIDTSSQLGSIRKCQGRGRVKPKAPLLPTVSPPFPPSEPRGAKQPVPEPGAGEAASSPPDGPPAARGPAVRARTPGEDGAG